jgi:hypothetical protein
VVFQPKNDVDFSFLGEKSLLPNPRKSPNVVVGDPDVLFKKILHSNF